MFQFIYMMSLKEKHNTSTKLVAILTINYNDFVVK